MLCVCVYNHSNLKPNLHAITLQVAYVLIDKPAQLQIIQPLLVRKWLERLHIMANSETTAVFHYARINFAVATVYLE